MHPVAKRVITGITVGAAVILATLFAPVQAFVPVCGALALLAIFEYAALLRRGFGGRFGIVGLAMLLVGAAFLASTLMVLPLIARDHGNAMLLYVIAIVKFSDVGGFAFGLSSAKLMKDGNHKLCPTISPNKSWEGLIGSIVFSSIVSLGFMPCTGFTWQKAVVFGLVAAIVGTLGDLMESKFKRWVGVKDSSTLALTNGLGGILDMLDSLLLAPTVLYLFI